MTCGKKEQEKQTKVKEKKYMKRYKKDIAEDAVIYPIQYTKSLIAISSNFGGMEEAKKFLYTCLKIYLNFYMIEK